MMKKLSVVGMPPQFEQAPPSPSPTPETAPNSNTSSQDNTNHDTPDENDFESYNWREHVNIDEIPSRELKRQDVINEFFSTEISHVKNLNALLDLFYKPLKTSEIISKDFHQRLFTNLPDVLKVHQTFNTAIKAQIQEGFPVLNFSNYVSNHFFCASSHTLIDVFGEFIKNQNTSIIELKKIRGRDSKLDLFLQEQERNVVCRRRELHTLLSVEHQRLVKYPLLLEQILKYTDIDDIKEFLTISVALQKTKRMLKKINGMMAKDQNKTVLYDIQNNLDISGLEKAGCQEKTTYDDCKNLYLPDHWLISEGNLVLVLRQGENKRSKKIYLLVLKECLVLLQKQSDKFLLKFQTTQHQQGQGADPKKFLLSPILEYPSMYIQTLPNDDRALNIISLKESTPEVYEFTASSVGDRDKWVRTLIDRISFFKNSPEAAKITQRRSMQAKACISRREEIKQARTESKIIKVGKINIMQKQAS